MLSAHISRIISNQLWRRCPISVKNFTTQVSDSKQPAVDGSSVPVPSYIEFKHTWPELDRSHFLRDMVVIEDFLSVDEEDALVKEVDPYMQRLRYEFDHWDDAIHGFRETERQHWYPHNKLALQRVCELSFSGSVLPHIHVLDLAEKGVIKPHVDSARYCGSTIAGLSLLSDCVMRLVRTDESKYIQATPESNADEYRNVEKPSDAAAKTDHYFADILLRRRSLYIMKDTARYNFTHEILGLETSAFKRLSVPRGRRISIICRNKP